MENSWLALRLICFELTSHFDLMPISTDAGIFIKVTLKSIIATFKPVTKTWLQRLG